MSMVPKPRLTPEEYLELEEKAEYKSEYYQGEMFAMAGAAYNHNLIAGNVMATLHRQLRQRTCSICPSDMRIHTPQNGAIHLCGRAGDLRRAKAPQPEADDPAQSDCNYRGFVPQHRGLRPWAQVRTLSIDRVVARVSPDSFRPRWSHAMPPKIGLGMATNHSQLTREQRRAGIGGMQAAGARFVRQG